MLFYIFRVCAYISICAAWFDVKSQNEVINTKMFAKLGEALGVAGLHGLDMLFAFMIKNQLLNVQDILRANQDKIFFGPHNTDVKEVDQIVPKIQKTAQQLSDVLVQIGILQTLRKHLAYQLNTSCKFDSAHLESSLRTLNE